MDQFLQKVKHTQVRDIPAHSTRKNCHDDVKASVSTPKSPAVRSENKTKPRGPKKPNSGCPNTQNECRAHKEVAAPTKNICFGAKRPIVGINGHEQHKRPKQAIYKQQATSVEALDRFRLSSAWLQNKSQKCASDLNLPHYACNPAVECQTVQQSRSRGTKYEAEMPRSRQSTCNAAQGVWVKSSHHDDYRKKMQPEKLDNQPEDCFSTCQPLESIMTSIYF